MRSIDLAGGTEILPAASCRELLAQEEVGRLGVITDAGVDVLPVKLPARR